MNENVTKENHLKSGLSRLCTVCILQAKCNSFTMCIVTSTETIRPTIHYD